MTDQVGNAPDGVSESQDNISPQDAIINSDTESFFEDLDQSVNGAILEEHSQSTSDQSDNTLTSQSEVQPQSGNEYETLQKRYSDSSREAQKLNGKLTELEPYMPILEAMREDPNLISHVRNYFEGGGSTPKTMVDKLNLGEDFVFDADDAFATPDSDSAKLLGATIDGVVQRRLNHTLSAQKEENLKLSNETAFRNKHKMSDDEWKDFVGFAKTKSLNLDDIYFLKTRENRDTKIANNARKQVRDKMQSVQGSPSSLANVGGTQTEKSPDDNIFDAILGVDQELESAFG